MRARAGPRFIVIGNPGGRRVELFQAALTSAGLPAARVVAWTDLLNQQTTLVDHVREGDVVRLESPGRDFDVERAILRECAAELVDLDPRGAKYARLDTASVARVQFDKGRILWPRQWFLGFRKVLRDVAAQLDACPTHRFLNDVDDVAAMFDKVACRARLSASAVAVPPALGEIGSFDELVERMRSAGWQRVFVKLAHGSSASGVVAYQVGRGPGGERHRAVTTVEMVRQGGELRLYNTRRLRTYTDPRQIASLVDALARHRVVVERWLPKAGIDGRTFDLRVVVIAGRASHTVVRLSRSPITNLHLLNDRADPAAVRARMGEAAWRDAMATCERAMRCFPGSLQGGVDLLVGGDFRRHAVLEVNAFGDLLPGVTCDGRDTYGAQIEAVIGSGKDCGAMSVAPPIMEVAR